MNTEYLKYILEIASCGSINQAAENLNFQRQYLSKILSNVEQQLNVTIFERNPKGVTLTADGISFLEQAERLVSLADKLENSYKKNSAIYPQYEDNFYFYVPDLNTSHGNVVFHVIKKFQKQFPNATISLGVKPGRELPAIVQNNPQIAGVVLSTSAAEDIQLENVHLTLLNQAPLVAVAAANNPIAKHYQTMSLETLFEQNFILHETEFMNSSTMLPPKYRKLLQNNPQYYIASNNLFWGMLEHQQYFSLIIYSKYLTGNIIQIPLEENIIINTYLIYHKDALRSFPMKSFFNQALSFYHKPLLF